MHCRRCDTPVVQVPLESFMVFIREAGANTANWNCPLCEQLNTLTMMPLTELVLLSACRNIFHVNANDEIEVAQRAEDPVLSDADLDEFCSWLDTVKQPADLFA